ncbi:MAG TPA: NmrA family NAD(P)-binding protein [Candidatus Acidoferrales bacterium]|nr:NmrA family NAD(P)-binding protein [Candidatus Acidoferrales bacterium]
MIVVTGATGHTGSVVAEKLLAVGEKVRVVGRSADKLQSFVAKGAEAFADDVTDAAAMTRAFAGADAVYAMIPPSMTEKDFHAYQAGVAESLATAIEKAGVKHVVALSSIGADKSEKCGPVTGLHRFEQRLNKLDGINLLHLRPGYFMENLLQFIGLIKSMGMIAGTLRGDLPIAMIATRDIGFVAAEALAKRDFTGQQTRELLGPRDVTMSEAAAIIGRAVGKPKLSFTRLPEMMVKPAMTRMGLSDDVARLILEMMEAMNSGWMAPQEPRSPSNSTPTTLETWVEEVFLPAYNA